MKIHALVGGFQQGLTERSCCFWCQRQRALARWRLPQVPSWSRIGRLKRTTFPKLTGGGHTFGGGAGAGALKTLAGRLLCDTYLSARELVKEVDYTLSTLAGSLLQQQRSELSSADVPGRTSPPTLTVSITSLVSYSDVGPGQTLAVQFHALVQAEKFH